MINTHLTDLLVQKQTFYRPKIAKRSVNRPGTVKTDLIGGTGDIKEDPGRCDDERWRIGDRQGVGGERKG